MAHEAGRIARWLIERLTNDEALSAIGFHTGNIHRTAAVDGQRLPYIVFSFAGQSSDDNNAGARNLTEPLVLVKVVSRDNEAMDTYEDALERLDDLLQSVYAVTEGHILFVEGEGLFEQIEAASDKGRLYHQGRYWRFRVTKIEEED